MDVTKIPELYQDVTPLDNPHSENDRFTHAKAHAGAHKYFIKMAQTKQLETNIQREVVWCEFMNRVEAFYPANHLKGPRIERRIGAGGLVFDWIDAPVLAEPHELDGWQANLSRYAAMLETFDRVAVNWKADNLPDEPSRSAHIYAIWQGWLGDNLSRVKHLEKARTYVENANFTLMKCMQHGDLTPWQIYVNGDEWIVIDGERCGTDLFRYTDLADSYARLYAYHGAKQAARELLRNFILHQDRPTEQFLKEFLPVLAHRSVAMLADAYSDQLSRDYVGDAEELLQLCVDRKASDITG